MQLHARGVQVRQHGTQKMRHRMLAQVGRHHADAQTVWRAECRTRSAARQRDAVMPRGVAVDGRVEIRQVMLGHHQVAEGIAHRGVDGQRLAVSLVGLCVVLLALQQIADVEQRQWVAVQRQAALVAGQCLVLAAQALQRHAQVGVARHHVRRIGHGLAQLGHGVFQPAGEQQQRTQVRSHIGVAGVAPQQAAPGRLSDVELVQPRRDQGLQVERVRLVGHRCQHAVDHLLRLLQFALLQQLLGLGPGGGIDGLGPRLRHPRPGRPLGWRRLLAHGHTATGALMAAWCW